MLPTDENLPRRGFLKFSIFMLNGLMAAILAVPGLGYLLTPALRKKEHSWIRLGGANDFSTLTRPRKTIFKYESAAG